MALIDDFTARFPEFDTADVDTYLPIIEPVWPCYFNKQYIACNVEAILNLVAHLLVSEISTSKAPSQVVTSKAVGSVSTSFAASTAGGGIAADMFGATKYGQRFLALTAYGFGGCAV